MHSSISCVRATTDPFRLAALFQSSLPKAKKRQIFAKYAKKCSGFVGGIVSHAFRYVSFTHSCASSLFRTIFVAKPVSRVPYL